MQIIIDLDSTFRNEVCSSVFTHFFVSLNINQSPKKSAVTRIISSDKRSLLFFVVVACPPFLAQGFLCLARFTPSLLLAVN